MRTFITTFTLILTALLLSSPAAASGPTAKPGSLFLIEGTVTELARFTSNYESTSGGSTFTVLFLVVEDGTGFEVNWFFTGSVDLTAGIAVVKLATADVAVAVGDSVCVRGRMPELRFGFLGQGGQTPFITDLRPGSCI